MNRKILGAPILTAALAGGLIAFTPVASATPAILADGPTSTATSQQNAPISAETGAPLGDAQYGTDPLVPYGTNPQVPVTPGFIDRNHDEGDTSNGEVDLAI